MELEIINGNNCVVRHIYPLEEIKVGQRWQAADGSHRIVTIVKIDGRDVHYVDAAGKVLEKDHFNFQCRYCLIVE